MLIFRNDAKTPLSVGYPRLNAQEAMARTILPKIEHTVCKPSTFAEVAEFYKMSSEALDTLVRENDASLDDVLEVGDVITIPAREQIVAFELTHDVGEVITEDGRYYVPAGAGSIIFAEGKTSRLYDSYQLALHGRGEISLNDVDYWDMTDFTAERFAEAFRDGREADGIEAIIIDSIYSHNPEDPRDPLGPVVLACARAALNGDMQSFREILSMLRSAEWEAADEKISAFHKLSAKLADDNDRDGYIKLIDSYQQLSGANLQKPITIPNFERPDRPEDSYWPSTIDLPGGEGSGRFDDGSFKEHSGMWLCGYRTGKTEGLSSDDRRDILANFMERNLHPDIKKIHGDDYGDPLSGKRLLKVANTLSSLCKLLKRRANADSYSLAIEHYEEDLAFLKERYFDRHTQGRPHLPWPDTEL